MYFWNFLHFTNKAFPRYHIINILRLSDSSFKWISELHVNNLAYVYRFKLLKRTSAAQFRRKLSYNSAKYAYSSGQLIGVIQMKIIQDYTEYYLLSASAIYRLLSAIIRRWVYADKGGIISRMTGNAGQCLYIIMHNDYDNFWQDRSYTAMIFQYYLFNISSMPLKLNVISIY